MTNDDRPDQPTQPGPADESPEGTAGATGAGSRPPPGDILTAPPPPPPPAKRSAPLTIALVVAVLAAVGAGAVIAVKNASGAPSLAERAPADVALFVELSLNPSASQKRALGDLLERLPEDRRARVRTAIDDMLESAVRPLGMSWRNDFKPWVGDNVAVVVSAGATAAEPSVVLLVGVKDAARARTTLSRAAQNADPEERFASAVEDGVAYIAPQEVSIPDFRTQAERAPLADAEQYAAALDRLGDDALAFAWSNGAKLSSILQQGGATPFAGFAVLGSGGGNSAAVLRVEEQGFVLRAHQRQVPGLEVGSGRPALVEASSGGNLGSLTLFDLGSLLDQILQQLAGMGGAGGNPAEMIAGIEQFLGLDIERDLVPWMQGEFTLLFGGIDAEADFPFNAGALIEVTDRAAATRTVRALARTLGRLGPVRARPDGFEAQLSEVPLVVRQGRDRVVIATSVAYAQQLMRPTGAQLANDAVYRRVLGGSADRVSAQMFLRVDRIRQLVEASMSGDRLARYEQEVKPILSLFDALAMRSTLTGGDIDLRMILSVAPAS